VGALARRRVLSCNAISQGADCPTELKVVPKREVIMDGLKERTFD